MQIDQASLHELLLMAIADIDASFNIWMSGTFALIIVTHLVGTSLKRYVVYALALMYIAFSLLYLGRVVFSVATAIQYHSAITTLAPPTFMQEYAGPLRIGLFVFGSAFAVYYLLRPGNELKS